MYINFDPLMFISDTPNTCIGLPIAGCDGHPATFES